MVSEPYASMYEGVEIPPPVWSDGQMADRPFRHQLAAELNRADSSYPVKILITCVVFTGG